MTQKQFVITTLEDKGGWVPVTYFLERYITRTAAIVHQLRKDGWVIESDTVEGKSYAKYRLISKPRAGGVGTVVPADQWETKAVQESMRLDIPKPKNNPYGFN